MASLKDLIVMGPARFLDKLYGNLEGNATSANKWSTPRSFTIGNTSKGVDGSVNVTWSLSEIAGNNYFVFAKSNVNNGTMNDAAKFYNAMGMIHLTEPSSGTASYVNPNSQTGWHHFINISYQDGGAGNNSWITQIANQAGSTDLWVRSRSGGEISNGTAWSAPWTRILTGSNFKNVLDSVYVNTAGDTMTGALNFANGTWNAMGDDADIGDCNQAGKIGIKGKNGATGIYFTPYSGSTAQTITINGSGTMTISGTVAGSFSGNLSGNASTASKVYVTLNNPASYSGYSIPFHSGTSSGNKTLYTNNGFDYHTEEGTTSALGQSGLVLGNSTASGTDGNKYGWIALFGTNTANTIIRTSNNSTTQNFVYLPSSRAYLIHKGDFSTTLGDSQTPVYITAGGRATTGTTYANRPYTYNKEYAYYYTWGGGQDLNWKKVFAASHTATAPSSNEYIGCTVKGTIYHHQGNHNQAEVREYPFVMYMSFIGGTSVSNSCTLKTSTTCPTTIIRAVRVTTNSFELQVRQPSDWQTMAIQFSISGNCSNRSAFTPVDSSNTSALTNSHLQESIPTRVVDAYSGTITTFAYSQTGLSTTSWFAAWNGYELRGISPTNSRITMSAMAAVNANGYYGMGTPDGTTSAWIRTTTLGIIPYQSGGSSALGTSSWPFNNAYINTIYGNLSGNASSASKITDLTTSDQASSSDVWRRIWFSYSDNTTGRPAYDDRFAIQTSTGILKAPTFSGDLSGNASSATTATRAQYLQVTKKHYANSSYTSRRGNCFYIRQYVNTSSSSTSSTDCTYYEQYNLPSPTPGRPSNISYTILTSKNDVTVAQGGTGSSTAGASAGQALYNLGLVYSATEPDSPTTGMVWLCPI